MRMFVLNLFFIFVFMVVFRFLGLLNMIIYECIGYVVLGFLVSVCCVVVISFLIIIFIKLFMIFLFVSDIVIVKEGDICV